MYNQYSTTAENSHSPNQQQCNNDHTISSWNEMLDLNSDNHQTNNSSCGEGITDKKVTTENMMGLGIQNYQKQKLSSTFLEEKKLQLFIPPRDENDHAVNIISPISKLNPTTPTTPNSALLRHLPPSQPRSLLQIHFKNNSFSSVISQQSTSLKSKPQNNGSHKQLPETNAPLRYSPSQNHSPSLNSFVLPPFVEKTNFSVSTCNLLPQPFVSSSYSRSSNISPKVESPSLLYSNSSIIKPFTFHFIKQKSKDNLPNTTLNNEEIQRLEFIYKKRSEILASQLIPKMEQFFRTLLSRVQELLINSVQIKTEENNVKLLDRIQHLLFIKKFISAYVSEIENFTTFLNSPNLNNTSKDDLKYLEDIEKSLNCFKIVKSDDVKILTWGGTDDQYFQYITQLSASFCICCNRPLPYNLQKCINYFPANHFNICELLKKVKDDQKTMNSNKFLTFTNNFTQIKKETYD